jgi:hypothetical protein
MSKSKRNIKFLPGVIKYNAIKTFEGFVKIPSYVIAELFKNKTRLEIYHDGEMIANYKSTEIYKHIKKIEPEVYKGRFKYKDITYKLNQIEI